MLRRIFLALIIFFTQITYSFAIDCSDIFPGATTFGVNGSANFASPGNPSQCNGGSCTPAPTFTVPTMPSISPNGSFSSTNLTAGVYEHTTWGVSANSTINFSGSGTAVIYFNQGVTIPNKTTINPSGNPENVLIIVNGSVTINKDAVINANIYATGSMAIGNYNSGFTTINGAVSAAGALSVWGEGSFNFTDSYVDNIDSHGFCEGSVPTQPIAEYRFDETSYDGSNNEVIDSIGGFHGRAIATQPTAGKVCSAVDLSASGTSDYLILDEDILNSKNDFTVSLWANTGKTSNQGALSGAGPGSSNELIMWYSNSTNFQPHLKGSNNGNIPTSSIADNSWHHLVWTRSGAQNCLYRDNVLQGCNTLSSSTLNIQSLILGQEQDSIGGGFSASQGWEGQIDEFLVFDSAISTADINQIYTNQNAGLGYDGSARTCPPVPDAVAIAEYRFDETSYTETANEVVDSIGSFHGVTSDVQPESGMLCNAADLSTTGIDDFITLNNSVLDNKNNFSISVWAKTSKTSNQSILSGASSGSANDLIMWFTSHTQFTPFLKNSSNGSTTIPSIADDDWHHLVWSRLGTQNCLYVDKVLQGCRSLSSSALNIESLILGQEQDSVGGGFDPNQSWNGLLDELLIFDGAISESQIETIYDNYSGGLGYDGAARTCPVISLLANFRFDECFFTGDSGDTIDQMGNYSATSQNGITSLSLGVVEKAAEINQYDQYFTTSINVLSDFSISTWFKKPTSTSNSRYFVLGAMQGGGDLLYLDRVNNWRWGVYDGTNSSNGSYSFSSLDNNWHHLIAVYSGSQTRLYIDGNLVDTINRKPSGTIQYIGTSFDSIGTANAQGFRAPLDEFMVFDTALSSSQITNIYNNQASNKNYDGTSRSAVSCNNINHYQIIHDGNGITCDPETVTIRACTNAYDGTCTLSTDAVTLDVVATLPPDITPVVTNNITFTGSTTTGITYTTPESVLLSIANPTIAPASATVCNDNSAGSCNLVFADAGFKFLNGNSGTSEIISNQISGDTFPIRLKAVKTNTTTGVCEGLFTGNVDVNLSQENITPNGSNPGNSFEINGLPIVKGSTPSSSVTLNFGSDSIATIPSPRYLDAGEVQLHASYSDAGINLVGSSSQFWVKPDRFEIDVVSCKDDGGGCDKDSPTTHKAGGNFSFAITAYNSDDGITENYRQSDGQLQLKVTRVLPNAAGSVEGVFTYASGQSRSTSSGIFSNATLEDFYTGTYGISTFANAQYNEVGVINVDVQDINYGGENLSIAAQGIDIGRFTPHHYRQTIEDGQAGSLIANHDATCDSENWVYSGQTTAGIGSIRYDLLRPILTITAYNAGNTPTENYRGDFVKLANDDVTLGVVSSTHTNTLPLTGVVSMDGSITDSIDNTMIAKGSVEYELSEEHHFTYTRNSTSLVAPFDASFEIPILTIEDGDFINLKPSDGSTDYFVNPSFSLAQSNTVNVRFGRWNIENAYGPETENLPVAMAIQQWNGTTFETNTDETCLIPQYGSKVTSGSFYDPLVDWQYRLLDTADGELITPNNTSAIPPNPLSSFVSGEYQEFIFNAPDEPVNDENYQRGSLKFEYAVPTWLKYDWQHQDGTFDDNPTGTISFGLFRGNDRIISWREVGN